MNINSQFPSKFLSAKDIDEDVVVTIKRVKPEDVGDGEKPVLYLREFEKGLVLNKTNANTITDVLGTPETDEWEGERIGLFVTMVPFQGKNVEAIRVKGRRPKTDAATAPERPARRAARDDDDDIPI